MADGVVQAGPTGEEASAAPGPGPEADRSVVAALRRVTAALEASEERPSQVAMAEAVAAALRHRRHLLVQAGTGTGKSMGYLIPILASGARAVVATATKALQDQLAERDLPVLANDLGAPVTFAVLKGRSNYVCLQRVRELDGAGEQLAAELGADPAATGVAAPPGSATLGALGRELRRLVAWARSADTGDRAELSWEPSPAAWSQVSVGPRDCPGAAQCPSGESCYAEAARRRAGEADVVVVNTHLYATHLAAGGEVLPPHDVVVFDEAHELEDVASASLGFDLGAGRLAALARGARPLLADGAPASALDAAGHAVAAALGALVGTRLPRPLPADLAERLTAARERVASLAAEVRKSEDPTRRARVLQAATHLLDDLDALMDLQDRSVAWVEGPSHDPSARVAPLDVGEELARLLWSGEGAPTGILTSATLPPGLAGRIGLASDEVDELDVGSPFDYPNQALLYCALHLPDPRHAGFEAAAVDELVALIRAAHGRTLALFTSWRAMRAAASVAADRLPWPLLTQSDLPKPALLERFSADEHTCLFATMGFWQGVDVPGPTLSQVVIDRLPFPRPDDPLLQARRERLGPGAFSAIDLPRAATLLAQGVGRLIRSSADRGVVAVLDRRLGTAPYRWALIGALPPMRRTRDRAEVEAFLAPLRARDG
jgi:ATP-dependent DNA helicase DinG